MARRLLFILFSIAIVWVFFADYLPPNRTLHFTYDAVGFHYPLLNHTFKSLKEGTFPEWDPFVYCGIPFAANIQAGLFYPPNWLLYAVNWKRAGLSFWTIQTLEIFHYWLGWVFAWYWLRRLKMRPVAAALGATTFALSGYPLADSQHYGVICAYAWFPLALAGVDDARGGNWRALWKTALSGAMCLLAGYPAVWFALALSAFVYALPSPRHAGQTVAALAASLALAAIQLVPTAEAAALREPEVVYGSVVDPRFLWQFIRPEYYKSIQAPWFTYLYLGAGSIAAFVYLGSVRRLPWRGVAILAAALWLIFNPFRSVSTVVELSGKTLVQVMQQWYFIPAILLGASLIAATGVDRFAANNVLWRRVACGALLAFTYWEFRHYGTPQHFSAEKGDIDKEHFFDARRGGPEFLGMSREVYDHLKAHRPYRVVTEGSPHVSDMRHYRLASPMGFDPLLPAAYKNEVERFKKFDTNREFTAPVQDEAFLHNFGVGFVISHLSETRDKLDADSRFTRIGKQDTFYRVWQLKNAQPAYRSKAGEVRVTDWRPKRRTFEFVAPATAGAFTLVEQFYPGWRAFADGKELVLNRAGNAFQSVAVPAGARTLVFEFRSSSLRYGAGVSALAWLGFLLFLARRLGTENRKTS